MKRRPASGGVRRLSLQGVPEESRLTRRSCHVCHGAAFLLEADLKGLGLRTSRGVVFPPRGPGGLSGGGFSLLKYTLIVP